MSREKRLEAALRYALNSLETANDLMRDDGDEDDIAEMDQWCKETREEFNLGKEGA